MDTTLHIVCMKRNIICVRALRSNHDADMNIGDNNNNKPLHYAIKIENNEDNDEIIELLRNVALSNERFTT